MLTIEDYVNNETEGLMMIKDWVSISLKKNTHELKIKTNGDWTVI